MVLTLLVEITKAFTSTEYTQALDAWHWLDLDGMTPFVASLFGHVFLERPDAVFWLDPIEGAVTRAWRDRAELRAVLATEAGRDEFLLAGLAVGAHRRGIVLGPDEIYVFTPPPVLGGGFGFDHILAMDFTVGMSVQGQLHEQLQGMPPGTRITGFQIGENP